MVELLAVEAGSERKTGAFRVTIPVVQGRYFLLDGIKWVAYEHKSATVCLEEATKPINTMWRLNP